MLPEALGGQAFVANEEGVERNYGGASEPFPLPSDATFTVVNSGLVDSTGPAVVSVSVSPDTIDTGIIGQTVEITLNITDALSGLRSASLSFINPESNAVNSISGFVFFTQATSGDSQDGTYTINSTIPQGSLDGTWTFDIFLSDQVGNRSTVSSPAGATFEISNSASGALGDFSDAGDATLYAWSTSGDQE